MARTAKNKTAKASKEMTQAIKTFKSSSEVQDLYRYIAENNLRVEAFELMKVVLQKITPSKKRTKKTLQ
jgi:dihydroxyacetone kinase-like predicted kinase